MTLNEFLLFVRAQLSARDIDVPDSIIIMHLNNAIKSLAKYFPDVFKTKYEVTATDGLTSIPLPSDFSFMERLIINDFEYFPEPDDYSHTRELTHRYWISENTLYFTPETDDGDEIVLVYYKKPSDLTSLSDTIELPEEVHSDLALYVTSYIAPTRDMLYERGRIDRDFRRRYRRYKPFREVKTWKEQVHLDNQGHYFSED